MRRLLAFMLSVLALLVGASSATAAQLRLTPAKSGQFPERAFLLTTPTRSSLDARQVTVTENGSPVAGLTVAAASAVGGHHFGTVLMIETSASMQGSAIQTALAAARSFAAQRAPDQPLAVVEFDSSAREVLPLSTDKSAIARVLSTTPVLGSGTHIFSAVDTGLQILARANVTAGAIVLLSDGALTGRLSAQASIQRKAQVISAANAQNVRVYAIGVHDSAFNAASLRGLAGAAGGTYNEVDSAGLPALLRELGGELSNQYLIRYRSAAALGSSVHVAASVTGQPGVAVADYSAPSLPPAISPRRATHQRTGFLQSTWAAILACAACALLLGLAVVALLAPRRSVRRRVDRFVSAAAPEPTRSWTSVLLERAFPDTKSAAQRGERWERLAQELELSRAGVSLEQAVALTALMTVVMSWLFVTATGSPIAAVIGLLVPVCARIALTVTVERLRRSFDEQLPDNLQVISAAMRAGHTFVGALALVAEDAPEPSRRELRRVLADEALGVPLSDALDAVTKRMKSRDFEHVALVASLQRETGGNTAEVIDAVTETIRERLDLRRLVRTLTAQGRLAGVVVSVLPVVLLLAIALINPAYIHPLFHTAEGIVALAVAATMLTCGFLTIRKIVDIKV
jgi:tight adherence protein B